MQETIYTPSDAQLEAWGISRADYKSLYSKAEADVKKANAKWYLPQFLEYSVGDVNKYLKEQMVKTNGMYGLDTVSSAQPKNTSISTSTSTSTAPTVPAPVKDTVSVGGGGVGGGSATAPVYKPTYYTADELAKRFGIVNDYATILKEMQDATGKKFDETETIMKRAEATNLRSQESAYNQYLQDLRSRSANAVASGATKGTMAANALTSLLGFQESNRDSTNLMNELLYDTAQQRGTALAADVTAARQQSNTIGQYLGTLANTMDTNDINAYAAKLAADAQTYTANVGSNATINAEKIRANAAYNQLMSAFTQDYLNKNPQASYQTAKDQSATRYADVLSAYYNPTK